MMTTRSFCLRIGSVFWRKLQTLQRISWQKRSLWIEAWLWLGLARFLVLTVPFKHIAPHLGVHRTESSATLSPETAIVARRVSWAIRSAARLTPWKSNCLAQAITAKRMLQRRGIGSTLYLGVNKNEQGGLAAHAWVRCGQFWLTGGQGHQHYTVVSTFAD